MKRVLGIAVFGAGLAAAGAAGAQDAYVIGVSAGMTGPAAATYAPVIEAMKAYIDHVNLKGGVNGKPVRLIIADDAAEPSRAGANAKRLIGDKALMVVNSSLSSTFAPILAETKRANVPLYYAGAVCPKETYPPADPLQFCSTAFGATLDSQAALAFVRTQAKEPVRIGFAAMAIPHKSAPVPHLARAVALPTPAPATMVSRRRRR